MCTAVSRFSWVEWDARMAIAARATRSFSQSAVAVLIAIYLGLHGFSLVQVGVFLTVGAVGAALAADVAGVLGDAIGRRRTLVTLRGLSVLRHGGRRTRRANRYGECHDRDPERRARGRPVGGDGAVDHAWTQRALPRRRHCQNCL